MQPNIPIIEGIKQKKIPNQSSPTIQTQLVADALITSMNDSIVPTDNFESLISIDDKIRELDKERVSWKFSKMMRDKEKCLKSDEVLILLIELNKLKREEKKFKLFEMLKNYEGLPKQIKVILQEMFENRLPFAEIQKMINLTILQKRFSDYSPEKVISDIEKNYQIYLRYCTSFNNINLQRDYIRNINRIANYEANILQLNLHNLNSFKAQIPVWIEHLKNDLARAYVKDNNLIQDIEKLNTKLTPEGKVNVEDEKVWLKEKIFECQKLEYNEEEFPKYRLWLKQLLGDTSKNSTDRNLFIKITQSTTIARFYFLERLTSFYNDPNRGLLARIDTIRKNQSWKEPWESQIVKLSDNYISILNNSKDFSGASLIRNLRKTERDYPDGWYNKINYYAKQILSDKKRIFADYKTSLIEILKERLISLIKTDLKLDANIRNIINRRIKALAAGKNKILNELKKLVYSQLEENISNKKFNIIISNLEKLKWSQTEKIQEWHTKYNELEINYLRLLDEFFTSVQEAYEIPINLLTKQTSIRKIAVNSYQKVIEILSNEKNYSTRQRSLYSSKYIYPSIVQTLGPDSDINNIDYELSTKSLPEMREKLMRAQKLSEFIFQHISQLSELREQINRLHNFRGDNIG